MKKATLKLIDTLVYAVETCVHQRKVNQLRMEVSRMPKWVQYDIGLNERLDNLDRAKPIKRESKSFSDVKLLCYLGKKQITT